VADPEKGALSKSLHALSDGTQGFWPLKATAIENSTISLKIKGQESLPDSVGVYLVQSASHKVYKLSSQDAVNVSSKDLNSGAYDVRIDTEEGVRSSLPQLGFRNVPNPFNTFTTFKYSVAQDYALAGVNYSLKVYSVSGEVVFTRKGVFSQGSNMLNIRWNGVDNQGTRMPNGSYFVRLKVNAPGLPELISQRKIVKLK